MMNTLQFQAAMKTYLQMRFEVLLLEIGGTFRENFGSHLFRVGCNMTKGFIAAIAATLTMGFSSANAAVVNFDFGGSTIFTITCAACAVGDIRGYQTADETGNALTVGGAFGLTGTAFNPVTGAPSDRNPDLTGEADEISFVSEITGISFTGLTKDETGNMPSSIFGEYILFKAGNYAGVLQNLTTAALSLTFWGSQGAGLSHVSEFSSPTISPVPVPAALPLLGSIFLFGGWAANRRRKYV
ncbi:MAG: hypothetical protein KUG69_10645 [Marinosulfonomonas sp.]|nr:hypothetical protein [Marinosulfonomonas sp.]